LNYPKKLKLCLSLLKQELREQKITYQQLADRLGVSLLTVKRQLNSTDIAFSKLIAICDAAGIEFSQIWHQIEAQKPAHTIFTKEQDATFCSYPHVYQYFVELFFNKKSTKQIQIENELTAASSYIYLRKLEEIDLISLSPNNKVTFLVSEPLGFAINTKFVFKEFQNALIEVSNRLIEPDKYEDFVIVKSLTLPDELRSKMYKETVELVSRYAELSESYFMHSSHPQHQLLICGYNKGDVNLGIKIINVQRLDGCKPVGDLIPNKTFDAF
jgi:transcriptional regulator with XRE-family HTH domain